MKYELLKRLFDIVFSIFGIVITSPIWIVAIIGIQISDPGSVFYKARRVGKNNIEFQMFKFRSMRVDRNADEKNLKADSSRIFKFGNFIRRVKIDELPQLINVLMGTMSVVGPRPASVDQLDLTRSGENHIVSELKPGLTGPAALYDYIIGDAIEDEQVYRVEVLPTRLKLDLAYFEKKNIIFDLKMILYTIKVILDQLTNRESAKICEKLLSLLKD